jgi:hypothetical protein
MTLFGRMLPGIAETWNAERIREILEITTAKQISAEVSRDLSSALAAQAGHSL